MMNGHEQSRRGSSLTEENARLRRVVDIAAMLEASERLHRREVRIIENDEIPLYEAYDQLWIELREALSAITSEPKEGP